MYFSRRALLYVDPVRLSVSLSVGFRFELLSQALLSEAETTAVPRKSGAGYGQVDLSEKTDSQLTEASIG